MFWQANARRRSANEVTGSVRGAPDAEIDAAGKQRFQHLEALGHRQRRVVGHSAVPRAWCSLETSGGCSPLCLETNGEIAMADDRMKRGSQDRSKINMEQEHEIRYWTQELGVSEAMLNAAVAKVGNSVEAVRRELHRSM